MQQCLPDPNNYHEFCRLLARLKSNYQLGELVKVENYPEVIRLIANFTVTSLQVRLSASTPSSLKQQEVVGSNSWSGGFCGVAALGVCPQQCPLPAESVAAPGSVCPLRQSHRAPPAGDLHPRGDQGLHHVAAGVGPCHPQVGSAEAVRTTDHTLPSDIHESTQRFWFHPPATFNDGQHMNVARFHDNNKKHDQKE